MPREKERSVTPEKTTEQQITELKDTIATLQDNMNQIRQDRDRLNKELVMANSQITKLEIMNEKFLRIIENLSEK